MTKAIELLHLVESARTPAWKLTREEYLKNRIPLVKKLEPLVKEALRKGIIEFNLRSLDKSLPDLKVYMYRSKKSRHPTSYDDVRGVIYLNLDQPSDLVKEVLGIKDKALQAYYALMHELGHHNLKIRGLPYFSSHGDEVEVAASAEVDAVWRKLLKRHRLAVEKAVENGEKVPNKVLAEYPHLRSKSNETSSN